MGMRLIDADELLEEVVKVQALEPSKAVAKIIMYITETSGVDAIPVDVIREWLYQIAINNVGTATFFSDSCVEIINRLEGLVAYAKERGRDNER
jgi:hypothetical protein